MEPLLLALDTSAGAPSVAVLRGERVLALACAAPREAAVRVVLPLVERALALAELALPELDAFAIAIGPGSFTGLRVGVATLKGLAFGRETPVAAVSSLRAWARTAPDPAAPVLALIDARRGEVYACAWSDRAAVEAGEPLVAEGVFRGAELDARLPDRQWQRVGVAPELGTAAAPAPGETEAAVAVAVGRLGQAELRAGRAHGAATLVPHYLQRAQAEVVRAARESQEAGGARAEATSPRAPLTRRKQS
jgi:tRNA threonylcarbamoyladenosine biosynthesis protein TsaB